MSNTREEMLRKIKERQQAQKNVSTIEPNPAKRNIKWKLTRERKNVVINGTPTDVEIIGGGFSFFVKAENPKENEPKGKTVMIPNESFKLLIIDHSIIRIEGAEYSQGGNVKVRSYWSNEMRQQDCMTTPFILTHKRESDKEATTHIDTYKNLKEDFNIKGRMHKVYGMTTSGEMVCVILPYYSYSKGTDRFKTYGDTLLDAEAKAGDGAMESRWLTVTGHVEQRINDKSPAYTAPKFAFGEEVSDDDLIKYLELCEKFDAWYEKYHAANIIKIDAATGKRPDREHDQTNHHESHNQEAEVNAQLQLAANTHEESAWGEEGDSDIPF